MKRKKWILVLTAVLFLVFCAGVPAWSQEKVNINTATAEQLIQLKGIGPKTAEKIIEYREANGLFKAPEDIVKVPGVGQKVFESNQEFIAVSR